MLTTEQISHNWEDFIENINNYISKPRVTKLLDFYNSYKERLYLMPASSNLGHHSAFPGGYIYHVNNVVENSIKLYDVWVKSGVDSSRFTQEELVFAVINHDLGKMGDREVENYRDQDSEWHRKNMGQIYKMNPELKFMPVQDRSLFLLQQVGIECSYNEWTGIKTHDGLYDESNKAYLMGFSPDMKPHSALTYILHQADLMSARIEFEGQYVIGSTKPKTSTKAKDVQSSLSNKPFKFPS